MFAEERFGAWRSCGVLEHFTDDLQLKPNRYNALEFKNVTPHDANRLLSVALLIDRVIGQIIFPPFSNSFLKLDGLHLSHRLRVHL
jgi:hypothetical protein